MKKLVALLLSVLMIFALVACKVAAVEPAAPAEETAAATEAAAESTPAEEAAPAVEPLKIAVLLASSPLDGGWGQFGAEGAKYAAEKLGAELAVVEASGSEAVKTECEALADEGYRIILGHGGEFATPFGEISAEYPDVDFISIGGQICTANQFSLQIATEHVCFIQGVVAALVTKTGTVSTINALDIPSFTKTVKGFEDGAKFINPNIKVINTVMTTYGDANEAYEIALAQIAEGSDVVNSNADFACYGIAKACSEKGVYASLYGSISTFDDYPDTVLNTITNDLGPAYLFAIQRCLDKVANPITSALVAGPSEGAVTFVANDNIVKNLPAAAQTAYTDYIDKLLSGEIPTQSENDLY